MSGHKLKAKPQESKPRLTLETAMPEVAEGLRVRKIELGLGAEPAVITLAAGAFLIGHTPIGMREYLRTGTD